MSTVLSSLRLHAGEQSFPDVMGRWLSVGAGVPAAAPGSVGACGAESDGVASARTRRARFGSGRARARRLGDPRGGSRGGWRGKRSRRGRRPREGRGRPVPSAPCDAPTEPEPSRRSRPLRRPDASPLSASGYSDDGSGPGGGATDVAFLASSITFSCLATCSSAAASGSSGSQRYRRCSHLSATAHQDE